MSLSQFTPLRIYKNIPEFLRFRKLLLTHGHVAIGRSKLIPTAKDYLPDQEFTKLVQSAGVVIVEAADSGDRERTASAASPLPFKTFILLFNDDKKYSSVTEIRPIIDRLNPQKELAKSNVHLILISRDPPSSHIVKLISSLERENSGGDSGSLSISHVEYKFLTSVRPRHAGFPAHRVLPTAEKEQLFADIKTTSIPVIFHSDPGVIWSHAEIGDVIEISFLSESIGYEKSYRVVRPAPTTD
jgi:DNA-directed RNA polymerase subunit H (RpoH/RPB5)